MKLRRILNESELRVGLLFLDKSDGLRDMITRIEPEPYHVDHSDGTPCRSGLQISLAANALGDGEGWCFCESIPAGRLYEIDTSQEAEQAVTKKRKAGACR